MATTPKSAGAKSRARITVEMICMANPAPPESSVTPAPRTARWRSSLPPCDSTGRNVPFSSKALKDVVTQYRNEFDGGPARALAELKQTALVCRSQRSLFEVGSSIYAVGFRVLGPTIEQ